MAGTTVAGYILAIAGLAVITLSNQIAKMLSFLGAKALVYTIVGAVALLAVGVVLILSNSSGGKIPHASEEVPIYEGEGKRRKIVGYQKAK